MKNLGLPHNGPVDSPIDLTFLRIAHPLDLDDSLGSVRRKPIKDSAMDVPDLLYVRIQPYHLHKMKVQDHWYYYDFEPYRHT